MALRLVCVVEGKGEVKALPNLCSRIRDYLEAWDWFVDPEPVRQPRGRLVDESVGSPNRPAHADGLARAVSLALSRPADGVLAICDADDDCAAIWGPSALTIMNPMCRGAAVMATREYEAWLLFQFGRERLAEIGVVDPEGVRDAKGRLRNLMPGYKPTTHQLQATQGIDLGALRAASDSFDKLVRSLAAVFGVDPTPRHARPHSKG